jgi:hypothetical protein
MRGLSLTVIGLLLLLTGCADNGVSSDNDKRAILYGGVTAGATRP